MKSASFSEAFSLSLSARFQSASMSAVATASEDSSVSLSVYLFIPVKRDGVNSDHGSSVIYMTRINHDAKQGGRGMTNL